MPRLILGHTTDSSIVIWVRASDRWPIAFVDVLDESGNQTGTTEVIATKQSEFWTATTEWTGLRPNTSYKVKVAFGKEKSSKSSDRIRDAYAEGKFKTFQAPDSDTDFSFVLGSCNLHSLGIFEKPDTAWI